MVADTASLVAGIRFVTNRGSSDWILSGQVKPGISKTGFEMFREQLAEAPNTSEESESCMSLA